MYTYLAAALVASAVTAADVPVSYKDSQPGSSWGETAGWETCSTGKKQSPIDLKSSIVPASDNKMSLETFNYKNFIVDAGYKATDSSQKVTMPSDSELWELMLTKQDESTMKFTPRQFHLHAPSEHTIDGDLKQLEIHFVHTNQFSPDQYGAVIGVFFDSEVNGGAENPFIKSLFEAIDSRDEADAADKLEVAVERILSNGIANKNYWSYDGSFTTPPCTEGIHWNVIQDVQSISLTQIKRILDIINADENVTPMTSAFNSGGNRRQTQPLEGRVVTAGVTKTLATKSVVKPEPVEDEEDDQAPTNYSEGADIDSSKKSKDGATAVTSFAAALAAAIAALAF